MEVSQSMTQNVLSRVSFVLASFLMVLAAETVHFALVSVFRVNIIAMLGVFLVGYCIIVSFLFYCFVSRPYLKLHFTEKGFKFFKYEKLLSVDWSRVTGYRISRFFPKRLIISIKDGEDIEFSYYAFSREQRHSIIGQIEKYHT